MKKFLSYQYPKKNHNIDIKTHMFEIAEPNTFLKTQI